MLEDLRVGDIQVQYRPRRRIEHKGSDKPGRILRRVQQALELDLDKPQRFEERPIHERGLQEEVVEGVSIDGAAEGALGGEPGRSVDQGGGTEHGGAEVGGGYVGHVGLEEAGHLPGVGAEGGIVIGYGRHEDVVVAVEFVGDGEDDAVLQGNDKGWGLSCAVEDFATGGKGCCFGGSVGGMVGGGRAVLGNEFIEF